MLIFAWSRIIPKTNTEEEYNNFRKKSVLKMQALVSMNVSVHETSLTLPRFTKVSVPSQGSQRSCMCLLGVPILLLFTIF
jgi:hypothetical protein